MHITVVRLHLPAVYQQALKTSAVSFGCKLAWQTCVDRTHLAVDGKGDRTEEKTSTASAYQVTVNGRKASLALAARDDEIVTVFSLNVDRQMDVQNLGAVLSQYENGPILILEKE